MIVKVIQFIFIFLFSLHFSVSGEETKKNCFFSTNQRTAIKESAATPRGQLILTRLKEIVSERRQHDLRVPLLEGGHLHDYFCPVHNLMFAFEWEKPLSHYCSECGKYWEGNNRYDWAWINKVHEANLKYLEACTWLYLANDDRIFAEYIRDMLLDYANKYPTWFEHNASRESNPRNSGKMFAQSLDESVWASDAAKAYSVAKEIMSPEEIKRIETGYLQPCADLLLNRKSGGNWQVWHNSGLIALGVALDNDSIINVALNDPQCGFYYLMEKHVDRDGWWDEGSPIYHFYPLRAMLLSAEALECRNINLFDKKLYNMLASPALGTYADLSFPAHNDGWYGESLIAQVKLYEMGYSHYKDSLLGKILRRCYLKTKRLSPESMLNPGEFDGAVADPGKSFYFADLGVGLLRYGNETVVLKYGPHGGGHGHPDKLSFSIHDGEQEILTDLGTSAYGVPDYREWYHKTISHSTVTVDENDQLPSTGKLASFRVTPNGGTIEAQADQAYEGIKMNRKLILDKYSLTDQFRCESKDSHQYDYVLILTKPAIIDNEGVAAQLDGSGYKKLKNLKKYSQKASFSCKSGNSVIRFALPKDCVFEVFTGEAPGRPPSIQTVSSAEHPGKIPVPTCYPLIIRVRNNNFDLSATWNLNK